MITLVKSDQLAPASGATESVEVDLGLGIDEAAKILGIYLEASQIKEVVGGFVQACYSFDPEDTVVAPADDEQFAFVGIRQGFLTQGLSVLTGREFFDFSSMNLITTRNLRMLCTCFAEAAEAKGRVYYEKYKPAQMELVQLIAQRR